MFAKCRQEIDQKKLLSKQCDKEMKSLSRGDIFAKNKKIVSLKFVFENINKHFFPLYILIKVLFANMAIKTDKEFVSFKSERNKFFICLGL